VTDTTLTGSASAAILARSEAYFPGGVNSPVRAFRAVGGHPVVLREGRGARVTDVDGRVLLDYVCSWGALVLGHAHPAVIRAIAETASTGTGFGMPTPSEPQLAELIQGAVPSLELMRFVSSGTEATMSAIRAARGFTGRAKIVKFSGCYHGHADALLAKAGSGLATLGLPDSAGVPPAAVADTLVVPFNHLKAVRDLFAAHGGEIAAVIVEPVAANMGVVPPHPGFLEGLREVTARHGALLIFDEVITGFRLGWGGAQACFRVTPDLTCLGKIIGGGLPVGAYGGRRDVMQVLAPLGPVYQAGTLAGNPVAMSAGAATLREVAASSFYTTLDGIAERLAEGLKWAAADAGVLISVVREASMLTVFFAPRPPQCYEDMASVDTNRFARFFHAMLDHGVLLPPSQFEAWFVSAAHGAEDIERTVAAARQAFALAR
jgi:glutamate-1-semialdehyde 2,1-aminomutase